MARPLDPNPTFLTEFPGLLRARVNSILRKVPAAMLASPVHAPLARQHGPAVAAHVERLIAATDALIQAVCDGTPAGPHRGVTAFAVDAELEVVAVRAAVRFVVRILTDRTDEAVEGLGRVLEVVEEEQAPVVARLRAEAAGRGAGGSTTTDRS